MEVKDIVARFAFVVFFVKEWRYLLKGDCKQGVAINLLRKSPLFKFF
jgi:hypothetical protein